MIARVVGLLTVVAALFSWMGGMSQSMSPPQTSVETPRQQIESRAIELPGSETESRTESNRNGFAPEEWNCSSHTRTWKYIVLHHTATEQDGVESIHEEHLKRKDRDGQSWMGIGYHFVIGNGHGMGDGEVEATFRWHEQLPGAHAGNEDYNHHGIGVVLVGNFENAPPSVAQLESVKKLVGFLKLKHGISSGRIVGHRDVKATACPGSLFPLAEVAEIEIE